MRRFCRWFPWERGRVGSLRRDLSVLVPRCSLCLRRLFPVHRCTAPLLVTLWLPTLFNTVIVRRCGNLSR